MAKNRLFLDDDPGQPINLDLSVNLGLPVNLSLLTNFGRLGQGFEPSDDPFFTVEGNHIRATYIPNAVNVDGQQYFPANGGLVSAAADTPGSVVAVTANGFTINLLFDAAAMAAPASFRSGIQQAAQILASNITDQITVDIVIDYSGTGGGAAAGPDNGQFVSYSTVRSWLISHASSGDTAFDSLPAGSSIQGQSSVAVWSAQLRLMGILSATDSTIDDGSATFATDINPNLLVGVALHELTHALGRVPYGPQPDIFDLFRFTTAGTRLFQGGATAPAAYFSIDGGVSKIADYGRNSDASDFVNSGVQGSTDPFNEFYNGATAQQLSAVDLRQLTVLGFHLASAQVNHAPTVAAPDYAATRNQTIAASSLFTANDVDGDAITTYQFWDSTTDPASGYFLVNGVVQGTNQNITVSAAQLASTTFRSGSVSDDLWVRAFDGAAWSTWKEFHVNPPVNHAPTVAAPDYAATHNQTIAASSLLTANDADGDAITTYQFWDSTTDPTSGYFVVNGVVQGTNQNITVSAAQLAGTTFQSGLVSDDLWVRAFDGIAWGAWKEFHVNPPVNHAPTAAAPDYAAAHNQSIAASSLFTANDVDGDAITTYQFWDSTTDPLSGNFVVNGVAQGTNQNITVSAAQLAGTTFQSGFVADDLWVRVFDGLAWSTWKEFHVNVPVNHAPTVAAPDYAATLNQNIAASSLFTANDVDGDAIATYQFWDSTTDPASGYFVVNGVVQGTNQNITVSPAQLAGMTFQSGSVSDDLWVRVFDGLAWSTWKEFHVNPPVNHAPTVAAPDYAATHNQSIVASSLFTANDADGDAITTYQFWDSTVDPASGYFVVNGVVQGTNQNITVSAGQLVGTTFQSGLVSDDLWVRAFDGLAWGAWKEFHVNVPVNHAPTAATPDYAATLNQNIAASSLFTANDADGDSIVTYQFWDSTVDPASGHFVVSGVAQGTNQNITVSASQLASASFQSGSVSDDLWVRVFDGLAWSTWKEFHVNPPPQVPAAATVMSAPAQSGPENFHFADNGFGADLLDTIFHERAAWNADSVHQSSQDGGGVGGATHTLLSGADMLLQANAYLADLHGGFFFTH